MFGILGILLFGVRVILMIGLVYGSFTGLFSKEGKYDAESTHIMTTSYIAGLVLGLAMASNLFGLTDLPFIPWV